MMGYDNDESPIYQVEGRSHVIDTNSVLTKIFFRMFLGLLATAITASYTYYSGLLDDFVLRGGYVFCIVAELVVALVFSFGFRKLPAGVVTALFYAYSILTGLTFSSIFVVFELSSIAYTFLGTAAIFGIMALIGKNTKADLTSFGTILVVSLLICLVVSLINIFIGNTMLEVGIDVAIILIFMGFTVYDINKIMIYQNQCEDSEKFYVYGAMELYLDFINLFIRILSIFGKKNND